MTSSPNQDGGVKDRASSSEENSTSASRSPDLGEEKRIQLDGIISIGDQITAFGDQAAVDFFAQMKIGFLCQREIVFLADHQTF